MTDNNTTAEQDPFDDAKESTGGVLYKWDVIGKNVKGLYLERRDNVKTKLGGMTVLDILTKDGELAVPASKDLQDKVKRIPANGSQIISITFVEEKKGAFPNPFKVYSVKYTDKTEAKLAAMGIAVFENTATADEGPEGFDNAAPAA